ncbi:EAL domain-containing protein [Christensenellaceae bacterium OttesenSCG-928-M15]|nr:EAL domain-containing protein [Christensenellaceae bacterium OttesenSCG-928-M15]
MIEKKRDVTDIIDVAYLQEIQDNLGKILGITTAVLAPNGVPLTRPTNLYAFCEMMQNSAEGVEMCMVTNAQLIEENLRTRKPAVLMCPNSLLKTAAVPIFVGEEYLGSWLIGQIRTELVDLELIERTAQQAKLSTEDAKRNIMLLPLISENEFHNILQFLTVFTDAITRLAVVNEQLNRNNSELLEATHKLHYSAQAFKEFIDLSDIGVYLVDFYTGELIMCNNVYANFISTASADELIGHKCFELIGNSDWCSFCPREKLLDRAGEPGEAYTWENWLEPYNVWLRLTSRAIKWIDGRLAHMVTFMDISDRKKQEEQTEYLAYYDQRLDIPNGMKLYSDINKQAGNSQYIICFDIQGLRKTNEVYGRDTGDWLLRSIRDWLFNVEGYDKTVYRVDGDLFAIRLNTNDEAQMKKLVHMIYNRFKDPWIFKEGNFAQRIYVSISLGVIPRQQHYTSYPDMITLVERIIDVARTKNRPVTYDEEVHKALYAHTRLELSLKECILNQMRGFSLNYQPIVDPKSGRFVGIEALCRWESPELGRVSPLVFIEEAERHGLIGILDEWVLRESLAQVKKWGLDQIDNFVLDVNLSPLQLNNYELHSLVKDILAEYDYPARALSFEITESSEVSFNEKTLLLLNRLQALGVELSLDDFGAGYASFATLSKLPVNVVKTDRAFLNNIETSRTDQLTYRVIADYAHTMGKMIIAEGVETKAQLDIIVAQGADYIQGYYFSKPLSAEDLYENLHRFML